MDFPARWTDDLSAQQRFVAGLASRLLRADADAEDSAQETLLATLRFPPAGDRPLEGWTVRVFRNTLSKLRRGARRRERREAAAARIETLPSAVEIAEREEIRRRLLDAVLELDEPLRRALLWRFYLGLSLSEVATREGVDPEAARSRIRRALSLLRDRLDARFGDEGRDWRLGLAILLGRPALTTVSAAAAGTAGSTAAGVLLMTTKAKAVAAAGVVLLLAAGLVWMSRSRHLGSAPVERTNEAAAPAARREEVRPPPQQDAPQDALSTVPYSEARPQSPAEPHGSLRAHLRWKSDRSHAAGIGVRIEPYGCSERAWTDSQLVRSDADGFAELPRVRPGRWFLRTDRSMTQDLEISSGARTEIEVELEDGVDVEVAVATTEGSPVADAEVWLSEPMWQFEHPAGRTNSFGKLRIRGLWPGQPVSARKSGYRSSLRCQVPRAGEDRPLVLPITLDPGGGDLGVTVVDPEGHPVRGALVQVGADSNRGVQLPSGILALEPGARRVYSDAEGRASVSGLDPGTVELRVLAPPFGFVKRDLRLRPGAKEDVVVRLEAGATLSGVVTTAPRDTTEEVRIEVATESMLLTSHADENGRFRLSGLPSGTVELVATHSRNEFRSGRLLGQAKATLDLVAGENTWNPAPSRGRVVRVRVVDSEGNPRHGCFVRAIAAGARPGAPPRYYQSLMVDGQGAVELACCPDARIEVAVESESMQSLREPQWIERGADELTITIGKDESPSCTVSGRVVDAAGIAIAGALVSIDTDATRGGFCERTAADGTFRSRDLTPGRYRVAVDADAFPRFRSEPHELKAGERWDAGLLKLEPAGWIEIALACPPEASLADVRITATRESDGAKGWFRIEGRRATCRPLGPGRYTIDASGPGIATASASCEVFAGETSKIPLALAPK